jgi:hypothetical protein
LPSKDRSVLNDRPTVVRGTPAPLKSSAAANFVTERVAHAAVCFNQEVSHLMPEEPNNQKIGAGQWFLVAFLAIFLIVTGIWAIQAWKLGSGVDMDKHGWIALALGTFFSLLIGCGLMALMFFSSRHGYDERANPHWLKPPEDKQD